MTLQLLAIQPQCDRTVIHQMIRMEYLDAS